MRLAIAAMFALLLALPFILADRATFTPTSDARGAPVSTSRLPDREAIQASEAVPVRNHTDWGVVGATFALVIVTAYFMRRQVQDARRVSQVQLFVQLADRYEGDTLRGDRKQLASELNSDQALTDASAGAVLDFFETIAYLTKRGDLDDEMVYNEFANHLLCYWLAMAKYIETVKSHYSDKELYDHAEWLFRKHSAMTPQGLPDATARAYFLKSESSLRRSS